MSEIVKLAKEALEKNELGVFLKGEGHYEVPAHFMVSANIPTDWTEAVPHGIYRLYEEYPEKHVDMLFEEALISISDDNLGLYTSLSVFYLQLIRERDNRSPFVMRKDRIICDLKQRLIERKDRLKNDFRWMGKNQPDGLWSEMEIICKLISNKFCVDLI